MQIFGFDSCFQSFISISKKEIKTVETIGQQLPTLSLVAFLHCLVLSLLDNAAIFLEQINATSMMSIEKQLS